MLKLLKGKAELINKHATPWQKPIHKGLLLAHVFNKYIALKLFSLVSKSKKATLNEWQIVFEIWRLRLFVADY